MRTRGIARTVLAAVAWLFVACIVAQVFLAGLGVFDDPRAFVSHREFGYIFGWLTLVMLVAALVGRVPRRLLALVGLTLVMFALQSILVAVRADYPAVAALHAVNGAALLIVAIVIARSAWALRSSAVDVPAVAHPLATRERAT